MEDIIYAVYTRSKAGNKSFLKGGFETEDEAFQYAESMDWEYVDEYGETYSLIVAEE